MQVFIESFINMARYLIKQKYALPVSQSREAIDELRTQGDLNTTQYLQLLNIMSFRRILFDDYLEI